MKNKTQEIFVHSRHIVMYGGIMALMVFALKWLEWKFLITDHSLDIYIGLLALFFTILGGWLASQLVKPKVHTVIVEKEIFRELPESYIPGEQAVEHLNLTAREYEVLQLLKQGYSNAEIADHLFLSLSTVKTHVSNLFSKMNVKNRVQAVEKAKRLKITA